LASTGNKLTPKETPNLRLFTGPNIILLKRIMWFDDVKKLWKLWKLEKLSS